LQHQYHLIISNNSARSYLLDLLLSLHDQRHVMLFIALCVTSIHAHIILFPFIWPPSPLPIYGILLVTYVSCIVYLRAHELSLMIYMLCVAILHGIKSPLRIFVLCGVRLCALGIYLMIFSSCVVFFHMLYPPLGPSMPHSMHLAEISSSSQFQTWEGIVWIFSYSLLVVDPIYTFLYKVQCWLSYPWSLIMKNHLPSWITSLVFPPDTDSTSLFPFIIQYKNFKYRQWNHLLAHCHIFS